MSALLVLQAESAAKDAGAGNSSSSNGSQPQQQQHLQALLGDKERLQQQVADLQQQLEAARGAACDGTQPTSQQQQQGALQEEVRELQAALEDREQELQEWQIHADVSQRLAGVVESITCWPPHHARCHYAFMNTICMLRRLTQTVHTPQQNSRPTVRSAND